jgi:hypothetical protein
MSDDFQTVKADPVTAMTPMRPAEPTHFRTLERPSPLPENPLDPLPDRSPDCPLMTVLSGFVVCYVVTSVADSFFTASSFTELPYSHVSYSNLL